MDVSNIGFAFLAIAAILLIVMVVTVGFGGGAV